MAINGKHYDWEDISLILPNGSASGFTEIKYSDEQPVTPHYGKGAIPRGYGRGNYSASGSLVMDRDEWEKLKDELAGSGKGGGIYDHAPFTIVVSYADYDMPEVVDTLKSVKITKFDGGGGSQGDDNVSAITCELVILEPILWGGVPAKTSGGALNSSGANSNEVNVSM
jgi:hypothetical protein